MNRQGSSTIDIASLSAYLVVAPQRGNTTDAVANALREAILDGALPPGARLGEDELARGFSVSRTPVREALRLLADEGLVVKVAHHGTVVAPMSLDDVLALYVVRGQLEGLAARLSAQRNPTAIVPRLEEIQRRMRKAARKPVPEELVRLNLAFHRELRLAAGNSYLERFLLQVEHAVRRMPSTFHLPERPQQVLEEHQAIIDAIAAQDADAAGRAAQEHMSAARNLRIRTLLGER